MLEAMEQTPSKQTLFGIFLVLVFGSSAVEITSEFMNGETLSTMVDDMMWFVLSAVLLVFFIYERRSQQKELTELRGQLNRARGKLAEIDVKSQDIANQYRAVMQKQFDAWDLTSSEQDVVIGMLKGLSFREIAELRDTREKTARQQASSVYRKAGVGGRNELVAWFFEDMLEPPPVRAD